MGYALSINGRVKVEDESVLIGAFKTFNFIGAGVSAVDAGGGKVDITIGGGAAGWLLDGNTVVSEKYIGTNDAFDFPLYTSGVRRITVKATGFTGFNTTAPDTLVHMLAPEAESVDVLTIGTLGTAGGGFPSRPTGMMYDVWVDTVGATNAVRTLAIYDSIADTDSRWTVQNKDGLGGYFDTLSCKYGNVGIGETTPSARFEVVGKGSDSLTKAVRITNSLNETIAVFRNDRFVGIGTDTPVGNLHVEGFNDSSSTIVARITGASGLTRGMTMYNNGNMNWYVSGAISIGLDTGANFTSHNYTYLKNCVTLGTFTPVDNTLLIENTWHVGLGSRNAGSMFNIDTQNYVYGLSITNAATPIFRAQRDGYVVKAALDAAIADGDLAASEMSSYIDETANLLIFKVKYAGGTVKTASLALI